MQLHRVMAALILGLCLVAAVLAGSRPDPSSSSFEMSSSNAVLDRSRADRIDVLSLQGAIMAGPASVIPDGSASSVERALRNDIKDKSVKGVLLRINSPGGTVGTSQEVYRAVMALRDAGKPVIVVMQDVAASGGYYVASAADKIYANPGTLTGSIGVIVQGFNASQLLNKVGLEAETYKTGTYKDLLSPYRPATPAEAELVQNLVDNTLEQFVRDVATGRQQLPQSTVNNEKAAEAILTSEIRQQRQQFSEARVRELADGRIFTGDQALQAGLIDALGGDQDAIADLRTLLGDEEEKLVIGDGVLGVNRVLRQILLESSRFQTQGPSWGEMLQGWMTNPIMSAPDPGTDVQVFPASLPSILWLAPPVTLN